MKLLGKANDKWAVASVSHYDYVECDGLMKDGGQSHCPSYAGYTRGSIEGETVWFEVPQSYADLYNDYQFNQTNRKYGIWKREDVRILPQEEWPDIDDPELKFENAIWGTRGISGKDKLKYVLLKDCSKEHLLAILDQRPSEEVTSACKYWIDRK